MGSRISACPPPGVFARKDTGASALLSSSCGSCNLQGGRAARVASEWSEQRGARVRMSAPGCAFARAFVKCNNNSKKREEREDKYISSNAQMAERRSSEAPKSAKSCSEAQWSREAPCLPGAVTCCEHAVSRAASTRCHVLRARGVTRSGLA
ncbi:unnamed protein product [Lampetra fluviatilis]